MSEKESRGAIEPKSTTEELDADKKDVDKEKIAQDGTRVNNEVF